jgi:hypothetical protein
VTRGPARGVPVPSLVEALVAGPGDQVRGGGWDLLGATGATVGLAGRGGRNGTNVPLAIGPGFGAAVAQAAGKGPCGCSLLAISAGHFGILPPNP